MLWRSITSACMPKASLTTGVANLRGEQKTREQPKCGDQWGVKTIGKTQRKQRNQHVRTNGGEQAMGTNNNDDDDDDDNTNNSNNSSSSNNNNT